MKRNVKSITIEIPNEAVLKKINSTPALRNLTRSVLIVGDNVEFVNHYQYSQIMRMFPICGCIVIES